MTDHLSREEGRKAIEAERAKKTKRPSKYGNKRVVVDGITFDSIAESKYYRVLKDRAERGEVGGVELQKPFSILGPKGELICTYKADFAFWDHKADRFRVIDVKGVETDVFKLKRKMMQALKGIEVEVVR